MNAKQERFAHEYAVCGNATKAAEAAQYSGATAHSIGSRLLKRPDVQAAIADKRSEHARANELTVEWVIERLKMLADAGIKGDSVKALDLLGKSLGMWRDRVEHSGPDGGPIAIATIRRVIIDPEDKG